MIARVLAFSVHQRWLVALLTVAAAAFGGLVDDQAADRCRARHHQ